MGNEEGMLNIMLAVETLETLFSLRRQSSDSYENTTRWSLTQVDETRNERRICGSPRKLQVN